MRPLYRKILLPLLLVSLVSGILYSDVSDMTSSDLNLPLAYVPGYDDPEGGTGFLPPLTIPLWLILTPYFIYKQLQYDKVADAQTKIIYLIFIPFIMWAFCYLVGFFLFIGWGLIFA